MPSAVKSTWWLVQKDLLQEVRGHSVWPRMLLLGLVLAFLLAMQIDLPAEQMTPLVSGLLWLSVFIAGTLALERSFASERDDGCWQALTLYPIAPSALFLGKTAVNFTALVVVEAMLFPAFIVFTDVPLLHRPGAVVLTAVLGNLGFAAVGTLVSGLMAGIGRCSGLISLVILPLATPVILGCAEATRLAATAENDLQWLQWIRLLAVFAGVFTVVGALAFEFVMEE